MRVRQVLGRFTVASALTLTGAVLVAAPARADGPERASWDDYNDESRGNKTCDLTEDPVMFSPSNCAEMESLVTTTCLVPMTTVGRLRGDHCARRRIDTIQWRGCAANGWATWKLGYLRVTVDGTTPSYVPPDSTYDTHTTCDMAQTYVLHPTPAIEFTDRASVQYEFYFGCPTDVPCTRTPRGGEWYGTWFDLN
jgi:hypothetical protein